MSDIDQKAFLLFALEHFNLLVEKEADNYIHLKGGYTIEIEGPNLFKLMQDGAVIAPFDRVEALCDFIIQDQAL